MTVAESKSLKKGRSLLLTLAIARLPRQEMASRSLTSPPGSDLAIAVGDQVTDSAMRCVAFSVYRPQRKGNAGGRAREYNHRCAISRAGKIGGGAAMTLHESNHGTQNGKNGPVH